MSAKPLRAENIVDLVRLFTAEELVVANATDNRYDLLFKQGSFELPVSIHLVLKVYEIGPSQAKPVQSLCDVAAVIALYARARGFLGALGNLGVTERPNDSWRQRG